MAATLAATLAANAVSANVTTLPNKVFSVQSTKPVVVESLNAQSTPDTWNVVGRIERNLQSKSFIAPSETCRIVAGPEGADIEVYVS